MRVDVKPLSVNECWQGRRFKTKKYKEYEEELLYKLPSGIVVPDGKLAVRFIWGFSSASSDYDNPIKPFQDVLQKKYEFNDNRICDARIIKHDVKKGEEYIGFEINEVKHD